MVDANLSVNFVIMNAKVIFVILQSLLMFASIYCVIISAWVEKGSLEKIWSIAEENGRIEFGK